MDVLQSTKCRGMVTIDCYVILAASTSLTQSELPCVPVGSACSSPSTNSPFASAIQVVSQLSRDYDNFPLGFLPGRGI